MMFRNQVKLNKFYVFDDAFVFYTTEFFKFRLDRVDKEAVKFEPVGYIKYTDYVKGADFFVLNAYVLKRLKEYADGVI
jgi:hypothetical protein